METAPGRTNCLSVNEVGCQGHREANCNLNRNVFNGVSDSQQKENGALSFLFCFLLNDYLNETSSIRKVVDSEKSVVERNCSRIV
jgi:hypothetical protein